jgi:hypothetical protein
LRGKNQGARLNLFGKSRIFDTTYANKDTLMALIEQEQPHTLRTLLAIGIPSFFAAVAISVVSHQAAHHLIGNAVCGPVVLAPAGVHSAESPCALGSLAGPVWTFGLALASFAVMLRRPHNLFFAMMAFVNASIRLPETLSVFFRLLVHDVAEKGIDEGSSLGLLRLHDQTIPTVIMCFYSIMAVFFALIVVHDMRRVPYKWVVALGLFLALGFVEQGVWALVGPFFT